VKCICGLEFEDSEELVRHVAYSHLRKVARLECAGEIGPWYLRCWCGTGFRSLGDGFLQFGLHITGDGKFDVAAHYLESKLECS
jgi:hypothetical protein